MENMIYCFLYYLTGMKLLKNIKNTILKIFIAVFASCIFIPSYAADVLNLPTHSIKGKFEAVSDGLIQISEKGISKTYIRTDNPFDIYTDYITYRISPISKTVESIPCKVTFVDTFVVKIKVPNSNSIEIPRYRVKNLEINIKN